MIRHTTRIKREIIFFLLLGLLQATAPVELAGAADYDIGAMGRECTEKIGVIEPFNCLNGELIPITTNGRLVNPGESAPSVCDKPSFLAPAFCKPLSRVGRLPSVGPNGVEDDDVQVIFICRRYNDVTDPNDPKFKDVAIVQHRKSTGDTCFFQHLADYLDATRVPPPTEAASQTPAGSPTAEQFWLPPQQTANINCNSCHDAGPFIHSPYIDQVRVPSTPTETIVFPFPDVRNNEPTNYRYVGQPFQTWGIPQMIVPQGNKCAECHVFGINASSDNFTRFAVGRAAPNSITEGYTHYPNSHWMPPAQAQEMPEQIFERLYGQSIDQILACGARGAMESAPECNRRAFGP
ncbi:hypothetical protein LB554_29315 [Mesorhizobium sp. CO1-1-11]|uniref:hypothetical protein n=1 Tax=Mesorhizobium sp. CO1-1-11 TaxID=2876636 RepID=UPI001CCA16AB|nr:hypothetical protein [Mesorhizobium sp. CO1-1-11]MBZ9728048.1 hypothetical protein [Mesorhizobium sp. CO1-1-11]